MLNGAELACREVVGQITILAKVKDPITGILELAWVMESGVGFGKAFIAVYNKENKMIFDSNQGWLKQEMNGLGPGPERVYSKIWLDPW